MKFPLRRGPPKPRPAKSPPAKRRRAAATAGVGGWLSAEGYLFSEALVMMAPPGDRPEALNLLSEEMIERHLKSGRRGLAVCGPAEGAGTSFICANLAIALSQAGVSTLLVDANSHKPGLHDLIVPPGEGLGLRALLSGEAGDVHEVVHADILPNLSVIYAGPAVAGGSELLAADRFFRFATSCMRDYALTIFDTPPANRSADARTISVAAGYAIIVARRDATFAQDMTLLTQQLEQDGVEIVGSILNGR